MDRPFKHPNPSDSTALRAQLCEPAAGAPDGPPAIADDRSMLAQCGELGINVSSSLSPQVEVTDMEINLVFAFLECDFQRLFAD